MTRFRCDGIFNDSFIANFQEIVKVKKIVNRSVFDEVMPKILLVPFFPGHGVCIVCTVYSVHSCYIIQGGPKMIFNDCCIANFLGIVTVKEF